jgi:MFS superfamily sulfate permease-like transporter
VLIFRPESSLIYFNVDNICEAITERLRADASRPKAVIIDLSAAPHVDLQSAHALAVLADELRAAGTRVQVVEARSSVRERFRHEGLDARLGGINRFTSVADVVDNAQTSGATG